MKNLRLILTGLSITILLLSVNRLTSWTSSYLQPFEFLRWLDFNAMIPIPLFSVLLYYLLLKDVVRESAFSKTKLYNYLFLVFLTGAYLFGASSGVNEVTNYLHQRFCEGAQAGSQLCRIVIYNDDEFSHLVYYAGFILMNVALMLAEFNVPRERKVNGKDKAFVIGNGVFIGLGIFANLAFEVIGLDLYFFGSMMILALYLLYRKRDAVLRLPVLSYFAISYSLGVVGTLLYKLI